LCVLNPPYNLLEGNVSALLALVPSVDVKSGVNWAQLQYASQFFFLSFLGLPILTHELYLSYITHCLSKLGPNRMLSLKK
jgi:hypothetical protein